MQQSIFEIVSNRPLTQSVYEMVMAGDTSAITAPGQFVNIKLEGLFLRRPISVCDMEDGKLTIVDKVVGNAIRTVENVVKSISDNISIDDLERMINKKLTVCSK